MAKAVVVRGNLLATNPNPINLLRFALEKLESVDFGRFVMLAWAGIQKTKPAERNLDPSLHEDDGVLTGSVVSTDALHLKISR